MGKWVALKLLPSTARISSIKRSRNHKMHPLLCLKLRNGSKDRVAHPLVSVARSLASRVLPRKEVLPGSRLFGFLILLLIQRLEL